MEINSIFIQNNATSGEKLQNLQQEIIGNCGSIIQVVTKSVGCDRTIQDLDGP